MREEGELDLFAGLWQEAPFARLPSDAPPELQDFVIDVEDPRCVYTIHRAARRHDFQSLVAEYVEIICDPLIPLLTLNSYVYQLRIGCGASSCSISTCFTCRKRLAGKAPIRRYSPLSARMLAVYLSSQDNPESGLCPTLRPSKEPPNVLNNLNFDSGSRRDPMLPLEPKRSNSRGSFRTSKIKTPKESGLLSPSSRSDGRSRVPGRRVEVSSTNDGERRTHTSPKRSPGEPNSKVKISERPTNKDHRSFAANMFGSVAFRMLEWLTPQGMAAISTKLDADNAGVEQAAKDTPEASGSSSISPKSDPGADLKSPSKQSLFNGEPPERLAPPESLNPSPMDPTKSRRSADATFRSPQSAKPRRRASLEPPSPAVTDEPRSPTKSPRPNGYHPEKLARTLRSSSATVSRGIPDIPTKPPFFGNVPSRDSIKVSIENDDLDSLLGETRLMSSTHEPEPLSPSRIPKVDSSSDMTSLDDAAAEPRYPPPQALRYINADIVDFVCDIFHHDQTGEEVRPEEPEPHDIAPEPLRGNSPLQRKSIHRDAVSRRHWKAFNEQTLFSVFSDSRSLIASFTADGDLYDSHTLWYCMFRLTRLAPNLVFHSLWMAADSLFVPPKALQQMGTRKSKLFKRNPNALSDFEAGCVMSICLHALSGSVPICEDKRTVRSLSWIRSKGQTVSTSAVLSQPSALRESFDDAFSHDLAVRLARRLCCALTARRRFAQLLEMDQISHNQDDGIEIDVLDPLFNQIDVLGLESSPVLQFAEKSRMLHQGRMQILIMEWARVVIFNDWDGKPDFSTNGPFAGALSLIESMCKSRDLYPEPAGMLIQVTDEQRELLQLIERDFQINYISDRLDSMDVAIAWLAFTSTNQRRHLLDYPYLFSPNTLVSFFRSINFSRMSRTYESSSSLKTRMNAIVESGSLITNPHHKMVLQDLLKTASSRYLILEINRENVLRDAFDQLWRREERELLRPLKVHLGEQGGEEGFDSGGVQQEFFRMAIAEFMDPHYGAFTVDDRTRMAWFAPGSVVELWKFELLGLLVSLAVFNGLTLPVTFPKALYRKLLNWPVTELHHIEDGWPDLASGLTTLQEWDEKDGAVEDIFARTYEFSVFTYGSHVTRDMSTADTSWPQIGKDMLPVEDDLEAPLVTKDNRDEYTTDYIRFLTDVSVRPQFAAFERGFRTCLEPKSLSLLSPPILQSLVEGVQEIDISELRQCARYVGWDASHRGVKDFWSVVKRYDEAMKRRLLEFVTASDRLPVGGMSNLQFVVQRNGEEEGDHGHLPTAYTCYGTLLLPEYKDKDVLKERLAMALNNAQGFGFA